MTTKAFLLSKCESFVNDKLAIIEGIMKANQTALEQESKSSVGDKHETGRAMLHLEMEKAAQQFGAVNKMKEVLQRINLAHNADRVKLGSLVTTDQGIYFISISTGQLDKDGTSYYAVSPSSPIGALLLGKERSEVVTMGPKKIKILEIQ